MAPVAPVAVFQKAPISCYLPYLSACGPPQTSPDPSPGLRAAQEGLQEPQEGLEELIFDEISVIWIQAGHFGSGKTLGRLLWPRKNLGRAIWAAENRAGAIWAAEKPCARTHSGILTYRLCIFDT